MALCIQVPINGVCKQSHHYNSLQHKPILPVSFTPRTSSHVVRAKKVSSRTGRFDSRNKRSNEGSSGGGLGTTTKEEEMLEKEEDEVVNGDGVVMNDGYFLPELPGDKPDFWEGEKWEPLGFFIQYAWAFGIVFALIACVVAVSTYNEGATDFKQTPVYQESIQSRDLLEQPDSSNSDVFEANPTEEAPSLE
ncbi:hypothetical protein GIB67_036827 [Kingdonia uniflora]|uniref:Uncharacterized protein n=1 Tax=Kingdonia uniflora TaxID=39325 RepID=A0A7J7LX37_9MAGN|nr:hypothetical protein GIB67_036827 [Kingdonia uniflora]